MTQEQEKDWWEREMRKREEEVPLRIFIGGGQDYYGPTSQRDAEITRKIPEILYGFAPEVQIVTGGTAGIPNIFAECWEGRCLDVVSDEYKDTYLARDKRTSREAMYVGKSQLQRRLAVTSLEGIKCAIFIQGGKYSTHEIKLFQEKGIPVVTLYGGGGAAGGQCPYEDWTYKAPEHVLNSIVASTDPNENMFNMANVLVGSVLHEISESLRHIREGLGEEPKKQRMAEDLKKSTNGIDLETKPRCPNCLVDPGIVDGRCKYGCGWTVDQKPKPVPVAFAIDIESRGDDLIKHGILSIGYCVGRLDQEEVIEKGRISLQPLQYLSYWDLQSLQFDMKVYAGEWCAWDTMRYEMEQEGKTDHSPEPQPPQVIKTQKFEERCLQEFWLNEEKCPGGKEKMQTMMAEAVDPIEGIKQFRAILSRYDDGVNYEAKVISDNIVFDGGWIDYYLSLAGLPRLQHDAKGWYRRVFDTVDYRRGACHMDYGDRWMGEKDIINHFGLTVNPDDHTHMPEEDAEYIYRFHLQLVNFLRTREPASPYFPGVTISVSASQPKISWPRNSYQADRRI